ncbi:unnamed protein product [Symbiodinium natans]|uniref:Uncharacterized protein n=1 Tax=Symbiodinium natans TaxID=878477 RepID=A0A812Q682_9DINO|nr:unnamed protein product [Symbiodinium natans]
MEVPAVELQSLGEGYAPLVPTAEARGFTREGESPSSIWTRLWMVGARCIVFDLTYQHVWSKFLAFLCFLNATLLLGEESFYSILSQLPSSSSCIRNHHVGFCNKTGDQVFRDSRIQVVLSPVESEKLQLEFPSVRTLWVVLVVAVANSRYMNKNQAWIVWTLATVGALLCSAHAAVTLVDLAHCGPGSPWHAVDWESLDREWASTQGLLGERHTPSASARRVAEYCWMPPLPNKEALRPRPPLHDGHKREIQQQTLDTNMTVFLRDMWIALMDSATFTLEFDNQTLVKSYCRDVLEMLSMSSCLRWLNSSELGNSIQCQAQGPELLMQDLMRSWQGEVATVHDAYTGHQSGSLQAFVQLADHWELSALAAQGCTATISGGNFALRPPTLGPQAVGSTSALSRHLLILAEGRGCEVPPAPSTPTLRCLDLGLNSRFSSVNESYLNPTFVGCVARIFRGCAGRSASATLTAFRSACQATCAVLMLFGYIRMLCMRVGCQRRNGIDRTWLCDGIQQALTLAGSRVGVGLLMASLLQVGFTVLASEVASNWILEGHGLRLASSLRISPLKLVDVLLMLGIWMQLIVFLVAVCYNVVLHIQLRKQILALPRSVLFGQNTEVPDSYRGPDLKDLKRMGSTSLVYAMYFPGIVFWHFFYASWILVLMFCFALGCLVVVGQPAETRSVHAKRIWPVLTYGSFLCSVLLAHFVTRLFTQRCLLRRHGRGIQIRCLCLFSWYEVMLFLLSFAVGPTAALWDYIKGFLCTVLASLIIEKPNFTQFGELADYVYCTYCAALLLERMDRDRLEDEPNEHAGNEHEMLESCEDCRQRCDNWDSKAEPELLDSSYHSKLGCLQRTCAFWLLFLGLPLLSAVLVDSSSYSLGYDCPHFLKTILPLRRCQEQQAQKGEPLSIVAAVSAAQTQMRPTSRMLSAVTALCAFGMARATVSSAFPSRCLPRTFGHGRLHLRCPCRRHCLRSVEACTSMPTPSFAEQWWRKLTRFRILGGTCWYTWRCTACR